MKVMHSIPLKIRFCGQSMFPVLKNGDLLVARLIPADQIKRGDIVCFLKEDIYIAHRVVQIERNKEQTILILKGDNLKYCDPAVAFEDCCLPIVTAVMNEREKPREIDNRPWRAWLSSHNLTYGIIRAEIGMLYKRIRGVLRFIFRVTSDRPG